MGDATSILAMGLVPVAAVAADSMSLAGIAVFLVNLI